MTLFFSLGSLFVARFIASSSAVYGVFATVVGIFTVMFITSNAVVFSYEIGVVHSWKLWPRGVDINLLFPADERAYALLVMMEERMPSQRNGVTFDAVGHGDPRRPDPALLRQRPPEVPLRPYDLLRDDGAGLPPAVEEAAEPEESEVPAGAQGGQVAEGAEGEQAASAALVDPASPQAPSESGRGDAPADR